jgi:hypothetical protein
MSLGSWGQQIWALDLTPEELQRGLVIYGSASADSIEITEDSPGQVNVLANGDSFGPFTVTGEIRVQGRGGDDTFSVSATGAQGLRIDGEDGEDVYHVYFGDLAAAVTVADSGEDSAERDEVHVYGTDLADVIEKTDTQAAWGDPPTQWVYYTGIEDSWIHTGNGNDVIKDPGRNTTILAGPGDDTIIINATLAGGVVVDGGEGSDTTIVACGALEGPVLVTDSGQDPQEVNSLEIVGQVGESAVNTFAVASDQVVWGAYEQVAEVIQYAPTITALVLEPGSGTNNVAVQSTSSAGVTIKVQPDSVNTCVIDMGNLAGTVAIDAADANDATLNVVINAPPSEEGQTNELTLTQDGLTGAGETIALNLGSTLTDLAIDGSAGNSQIVVEGSPTETLTLDNVLVVTTTTVTSSPSVSVLNAPVTFTAIVSAGVGAGTPTGEVQFQVDGVNLDAPVPLSDGLASITTSALPGGTHTVTALYSGDALFVQSSGSVEQSVQYVFSGFLPPLNSNLAFGLNRTIPIKFQLADSQGAFVSTLEAVASLQALDSSGATNVLTNAGSTILRYDSASNQFIANWQTKGLLAGDYTISLQLNDGTTHTKPVQLTTAKGAALLADSATNADASATAGQLLAGDLTLLVDDSSGLLTSEELARIQEAVSALNAVVAPYGVTIYRVDAAYAASANVVVHVSTTSVVGGYADGVLGCTTDLGEITLIQGWNWYAGADAGQIGLDQYDFQTVVTHELGHALGLGHSEVSSSVMYATLSSGVTSRALTTQDLNVGEGDDGPSALRVAVPQGIAPAAAAAVFSRYGTTGHRVGCFDVRPRFDLIAAVFADLAADNLEPSKKAKSGPAQAMPSVYLPLWEA